MKLLCVDTATAIESIALIDGHVVLTERAVRRTKGHGPGVLDDIDEALAGIGWKLADLDGFACGLGPGSFTGLRIALATLKGL
ncbi:MAG: tRNA (adenosine(37)-N6)-threonylcarbamoyltransferase complex dimerization subunit type 1 TsaB, partial [Myxococcales bacterium]|nr:tRNA (adenosine(37)-N6)-threonylcarbamoyltransferase complex dimerization subunit type 1 TsaB [Myxococcales bacterium]